MAFRMTSVLARFGLSYFELQSGSKVFQLRHKIQHPEDQGIKCNLVEACHK